MKIHILLATFQSEKFLEEQLDSILDQEYRDFQLFIRDGGSSDSTLSILKKYEKKDARIRFLGSSPAGVKENFSVLMEEASGGDLYLFADHDDVWFPHKLGALLELYGKLEKEYSSRMPLLVFSDSTVTDENLCPIAFSHFRYQNLDPRKMELSRLLLQNVPSGNTMLFNEEMRLAVGRIPEKAVYHDHYMALVASAIGKYACTREPLLFYRQHKKNVCGAKAYSLIGFFWKLSGGISEVRKRLYENLRQGEELLARCGERLSVEDREMLAALSSLENKGFWERRRLLWKYRIRKNGFFRNLGMYIIV